ncbi:BTAD domain-containing putative transcriptional regulator [Streptomyces sp. NPDC056704]|uniref:AfsR/SARP family transcriptional regulator n=1 Tax=Streptomyces sp. NPDC056704 TaxID=3345917 RepID=UPI00367FEFF3
MSWTFPHLKLLGDFEVTHGGARICLHAGAQRLLAFLALQSDGVNRQMAAERLWPDCPPCRAAANVRTALYQIRHTGMPMAIESLDHRLRLSPSTGVDLHSVREHAQSIVTGLDQLPVSADSLTETLSAVLLPNWAEEWLVLERERWGHIRLHALESLAQQFLDSGRYLPALQAALAATSVDPIRETAHRIMMEVYVAEGNVACAIKCYKNYREFLEKELGAAPSSRMAMLARDLLRSDVRQRM